MGKGLAGAELKAAMESNLRGELSTRVQLQKLQTRTMTSASAL